MYFTKEKNERGSIFLSWEFVLVKILLFGFLSIALEKPVGSLAGQIALQQAGFGLYSYDIRKNRVFALAIGPRGSSSNERGVWVDADGTFKIDQLPVGEYMLKIRAPGYSTAYPSGLFVSEGKATQIPKAITMHLLEPQVAIGGHRRVFTTKEKPSLWVNASDAVDVKVKLYKGDFLKFAGLDTEKKFGITVGSDFSISKSYEKKFHLPFTKQKPFVEYVRKLPPGQDENARLDFQIDKPVSPGDYFVVVEANAVNSNKKAYDVGWFMVSDIGLIVKRAPEKALVRAIDLNTMKPLSGVTIQAYDVAAGQVCTDWHSKQTSNDGLALFEFDKQRSSLGDGWNLALIGTLAKMRAYDNINYYGYQSSAHNYKTYFYTDRSVYRLGQTVYYKGIIRSTQPQGLENPGGDLSITATVQGPENNEIWQGNLKTTDLGTFNGSFQIPEEGKTGNYQLLLHYPDGQTGYENIEVAQYRKPEYQVDVMPLKTRLVAGEKVKARIKAAYYFGAPVALAEIKYSIYSSVDWNERYKLMVRPDYYQFFDDWEDSDRPDYFSSYGGGDFITEGHARTDESGEAVIEFETKPIQPNKQYPYSDAYLDKRYRIEAEVTDISRLSVLSSSTVLVTAGDFELFVNPRSYVVKVGENLPIEVQAVDYDKKPVASQSVTLKLTRWPYDSVRGEYKPPEVVAEANVFTDSEGKAQTTFLCKEQWPTDTFYITGETNDKGGHVIGDSNSVWIASENYPYYRGERDAQREPVSIKLDKSVYKSGETAKIMITAPVTGHEGIDALVTVEGLKLYSYQLVPLKATAQLVEIPLSDAYAPNVYVSVCLVGNKCQFYKQEKVLKVSPEFKFLNVSVTTNKAKYKPRESVQYTIKATRKDGTPAQNTEFSLAVVDESIYAIRPDTTERIEKFFYRKRDNWVGTSHSFPEDYSGGPDKMEPAVRKDFRDTAAWIPELRTNKDGIVTATIKLPDNLTTWRATVRGVDILTNVGAAMQKVIVTQELIARLALPRFFSQGDEGLVTAVVHNYTDRAQSVKLNLAVSSQFRTNIPLAHTLSIQPQKAGRFSWPVSITQPGVGLVRLKAMGDTAGDALELKIPIRPLGILTFASKSGLIIDETATVTLPLGLSADAQPTTAKYALSLASSSIGPVLGNFNALIDYPYGCTEQTMSRLVPSIVAIELNKKLHLPISSDDVQRFSKVYKKAIAKLKDYHHSDGGWGWWPEDNSSPYLTAYVVDGLRMLKQAGYDVDESMIKGGRDWMKKTIPLLFKQLTDPKRMPDDYSERESSVDLAFMFYTLSLWQEKPAPEVRRWLLASHKKYVPEALSYLTLAFKNTGDEASAKTVYNRLISLANTDAHMLNWDHTAAMSIRLGCVNGSDYSYRFTGVESTALVLKAVLAMEPDNLSRVESIKQWILLQRGKSGWENTKTTAEVFLVLLEDELHSRSKMPTDYIASVGMPRADFFCNFNTANAYAKEKVIDIPVTRVPSRLLLEKKGSGRLYYNGLLTFFRELKPGDKIAAKSLPSSLHIARKFFRLTPTAKQSDGTMRFHAKEISDGQVRAGETILMKVYVDAPVALPYIIVEAPLPSGGEVVQHDARDSNLDSSSAVEGDWGAPWWTHQDILDDRIVFFGTQLKAGKSEFHTMIRMELPGKIQMNPVCMEGMYTKNVRAYSQLDAFQVRE